MYTSTRQYLNLGYFKVKSEDKVNTDLINNWKIHVRLSICLLFEVGAKTNNLQIDRLPPHCLFGLHRHQLKGKKVLCVLFTFFIIPVLSSTKFWRRLYIFVIKYCLHLFTIKISYHHTILQCSKRYLRFSRKRCIQENLLQFFISIILKLLLCFYL